MKTCITCLIEKEENENNFELRKDNNKYRNQCRLCRLEQKKLYYEDNTILLLGKVKEYQQNNKEKILEYHKEYYEENKESMLKNAKLHYENNKISIIEYQKEYREEHKEIILEKKKEYLKNRRSIDPAYRMRSYMSRHIAYMLKCNGATKSGISSWKNLPYTPQDLVNHIEAQFKISNNDWMSWNNQGKYISTTWNDNDSKTWTWQLDHIIPHSTFHYVEPAGDIFLACWSLENLRPLSAKQNNIDSNKRTPEQIQEIQNKQKEILCKSNKLQEIK